MLKLIKYLKKSLKMLNELVLITPNQEKFCFHDNFYVFTYDNYVSLKNFNDTSNILLDNKSITENDFNAINRIITYLSSLEEKIFTEYKIIDGKYKPHYIKTLAAPIQMLKYNHYAKTNGVKKLDDLNHHIKEINFILDNLKLIKKCLKFTSNKFNNYINKNIFKKINTTVATAKLFDTNEVNTKEVSFVIYLGNKNTKSHSFLNKNGYPDSLNNAMLFEDVNSAKRSASARGHKNYSILEVNINLVNIALENGQADNEYRDQLLSLTQKERIINELEKDDIQMLRKKLEELEEKYPEEKTEKVVKKRKM